MNYIDHFNEQSENYLFFRPTYPEALYDYLLNLAGKNACVWDCATGNGQAAIPLAERFRKVIATDISQTQLDVAIKHSGIEYVCSPAEHTPIQANSIDLITVAQALHWFGLDAFYQEVRRVGKPSALLAVWCYPLGVFKDKTLDKLIRYLYEDILVTYWPKERYYIDEAYQTIAFPFKKLTTPDFIMEKKFGFKEFCGYLGTWSAIKEYQKRNGSNPLQLIVSELAAVWGDLERTRIMTWPLHLLVGRISG